MPLSIRALKELCDKLIEDGFAENQIMLTLDMGWCEIHAHSKLVYSEIRCIEMDMKRNILLFGMGSLEELEKAMDEYHEQDVH